MTDNKEKREFEEIMDKIFGTEPSRYSAWNKELFLQMFNEAYAKGRQSVLSKIPSEDEITKESDDHYVTLEGRMIYFDKAFRHGVNFILSKLSDDKGG